MLLCGDSVGMVELVSVRGVIAYSYAGYAAGGASPCLLAMHLCCLSSVCVCVNL